MKRIDWACIVLLLITPVTSASTQTPVATPDPFALPVNLLVLRIREGNGYGYVRDQSGAPLYGNGYLVRDGEIATTVPPPFADFYEDHEVHNLYDAYTIMVQDEEITEPSISIAVQVRLATVPDGDMAGRLVDASPAFFTHLSGAGDRFSQDIIVMTDLPDHDEAITGFTGTDQYDGLVNGDAAFRMPFTRFIAQHGTIVASIKVTGPDPAFNDAVARELLAAQLACIAADQFCVPVPLPSNVPFEPGTPVTISTTLAPAPGPAIVRSRA